jgi:peptidoglycan hydrolase-like protein with peptidoglycan-binding domain
MAIFFAIQLLVERSVLGKQENESEASRGQAMDFEEMSRAVANAREVGLVNRDMITYTRSTKGTVLLMNNENAEEPTELDEQTTASEDVTSASVDVADSSGDVQAPVPAPVPSAGGAAVTKEGIDPVLLSVCIYKNPAARKSLTIHHLQRRLNELGYHDAYGDKDGWYGDLTRAAVAAYQKDNGLVVDGREGLMDEATLKKIFAGDSNVFIAE